MFAKSLRRPFSKSTYLTNDFNLSCKVDVDVEEIRAQTIGFVTVLNIQIRLLGYLLKLSNCNFTAVYGSVNLSTKIINNLLIFPEVIASILETIYEFCRDNITRQRIPHINNSVGEIVFA